MRLSIIALIALAGCASFAGRADYAAYRAYRVAESPSEQLAAIGSYLEAHPQGKWADEMRVAHAELETDFFDASKGTGVGLRAYLDAYPSGAFVAEAERRLAALEAVAERREGEDVQRRERVQEVREQAQAARRQWAAQAVEFWSRILLGVTNWGEEMSVVVSANDDFNDAFRAEPRPRCSDTECVKFYSLSYSIAVPGQTRMERTIRLLLRLRLDEGRLMGVELLMPNRGFSRWYELENETFVADLDPESRQATVNWAVERIIPIVRGIAPTAIGIDVAAMPIEPVLVRESDDAPPPETETETSDDSLILPLALQGLQQGNVRVVVFAAADEDEGEAYDGFYVELMSDEEPE